MTNQNFDYYLQRADEELAAANHAVDPGIAQIHREMAQRYRDLWQSKADDTGPIAGLGSACG